MCRAARPWQSARCSGVPRAHGQTGAFVSQWTIHLDSLLVHVGYQLSP
jgi:hypothetical protein